MDQTPESVRAKQHIIDEFVTNKRGVLTFPLLFIENASDALPVIESSLELGTLPLVFQYRDKLAELKKIAVTPENFSILFSIFKLVVFTGPKEKHEIKNLFDITSIPDIEVSPWRDL